MISGINHFGSVTIKSNNNHIKNNYINFTNYNNNLSPLKHDTISFKSTSLLEKKDKKVNQERKKETHTPKLYIDITRGITPDKQYHHIKRKDFLSKIAETFIDKKPSILGQGTIADEKRRYRMAERTRELWETDFPIVDPSKIKLASYIPKSLIENEVKMVNVARSARLTQWKDFLENDGKGGFGELFNSIKTIDKSQKNMEFVRVTIWSGIVNELKSDNRYIPAPLDKDVLATTISNLYKIPSESILKKRGLRKIVTPSRFINTYSHMLIQNLIDKKGLDTGSDEIWVKVPSKKHDLANFSENVRQVEILSNRNWCTRSVDDKAEDALIDGDFHVMLKKDKKTKFWEPEIAMTCYNGKISQIQGRNNDNYLPTKFLDSVKQYIQQNGLVCSYNVTEEFPESGIQILIAEKLREYSPEIGETAQEAIKNNHSSAIFHYLNQKGVKALGDGTFEIGTYKPIYVFDNKGHNVPYSMLGIDEDKLLGDVRKINGDFYMTKGTKPLYNAAITRFPEKLEEVTGCIYCTPDQYQTYNEDIKRVNKADGKNKQHSIKIV